jgi:hypothetical protein
MSKLKRLNQVLIGLFIFLLPWQTAYIFDAKFIGGAKWQYGTGLIFATEILLWLIALLQLTIMIKVRKAGDRELKINRSKLAVTISLWLLVAWSGLSLLWAPEKSAGFYNWFHLLEAAGLFFIILSSKIDRKKIYYYLTLAGVLQALLAITQFLTQSISANKWLGIAGHLPWQSGEIVIESSGRWLRAYGAFAHPNVLGGFLVICFFATIIPALAIDGRRNTPWRIIATLLLLAGIFFSFSRSAWLALIIGMVIIFIREIIRARKSAEPAAARYRNLAKYFLAPLVLAVVLFFIYSPLALTRASTADRLEAKSVNERLTYFSQAGDLLKDHWPIGVGEGNYTYALYQTNPTLPAWSYQPVHNVFVLIFAELGIVGIVIFIFLLISLFLNFLISNRSEKEKGSINELAFFTTLLTIIIFDHYLWTSYAGVILLFLSLALILKKYAADRDN